MPTLKVIGSGSKGNTYLLETSKETLILDLGCKWSEVKECSNFKNGRVVGALCSHCHLDHSKYIQAASDDAVRIYSNKDVSEKFSGVEVLEPKKKYKIGSFIVMPLNVPHNVENYAYIIEHEEFGKLCFITDCTTFPYRIKDINHFLIEANYSKDIHIDNLCKGYDIMSHNEHHMEINKTKAVLGRNFSPDVQSITLCHISSSQGNSKLFKDTIQELFPLVNVNVAKAGVKIELNKDDF